MWLRSAKTICPHPVFEWIRCWMCVNKTRPREMWLFDGACVGMYPHKRCFGAWTKLNRVFWNKVNFCAVSLMCRRIVFRLRLHDLLRELLFATRTPIHSMASHHIGALAFMQSHLMTIYYTPPHNSPNRASNLNCRMHIPVSGKHTHAHLNSPTQTTNKSELLSNWISSMTTNTARGRFGGVQR